MDLSQIPFIAALNRRRAWLEQRQEVLAHNIANADTPGFRPHDLRPLTFRRMIDRPDTRLQLAATRTGHLPGLAAPGPFRSAESRRTYETAPDGNAVVLEEQLAKVDQTKLGHKLVNELYRKHLSFFRIAAGNR